MSLRSCTKCMGSNTIKALIPEVKDPNPTKRKQNCPHHSPVVCHKALPQTQLPENIHHYLHRCVVCHGERAHVKYASKLQRPRAFCWKRWGVLGKTDPGTANNPFLLLPCTFFKGREGKRKKKSKEIYILVVRSFRAKFSRPGSDADMLTLFLQSLLYS